MSEVQAYLTDLQGQVVATVAPSELITFGQHESNTIQLDDFSISPQHGAIAYRGGAFVVERWSRGRIWINSQQHPVEGSRMLQDNDRVLIGNRHVFVFHLGKPQVSAPTVPAMPSSPPEPVRTMVEGATPPAEAREAPAEVASPPDEAPSATPEAALETMIEQPGSPADAAPQEAGEAGSAEAAEDAAARDAAARDAAARDAAAKDAAARDAAAEEVAAEPPAARLDTGFMPAWERTADDADAPPSDAAGADDTLLDAPEAPAPPTPVPDWAMEQARTLPGSTPPEGVNVPPTGWEQELEGAPTGSARATTDDDIWGVRQRSEARRLIQEAVHMLRQGYADRARQKLNQALRLNESNEDAWLWLAAAETDPDRRRGALQRVLTINPNNVAADWGLLSMQAGVAQTWRPPQPQTTPTPPGGTYVPQQETSGASRDYGAAREFGAARELDMASDYAADYTETSIPALLRPTEPRAGRGRTWLARALGLVSLVMLGVALYLSYGVWTIEEFALWGNVPPLGQVWTGLEVWGFVGIAVMVFAALLILLIRAAGRVTVGVLLTITGLAIIFMAVLPILFGLVIQPQVGAVVLGAAGLPLMVAGLLKIW